MKRRKRTGIVSMLFFGIALILTGCGGSSGGGDGISDYSIGGTVSGLSGTVVLQNNGGDNLSITADGAFTFSTALADGSGYNITVKIQPDGQTCRVSNGTGIISGEDVTDVTVTCSVDTYTVGGTVNGLSGTLVLQNNGGDDLTITSDSAFTFNTALADSSTYSTTILTPPVLQDCTVANGSGTINGADVSDISVTCADKPWTNPESLADNISPDGQDAYRPQVAMDNNGNTVIVWDQYDGSNWQIFKSEYRNGIWTNPASLTDNISPDGQNAWYPQVAVDNNGNAIIVWHQCDYSTCQIFKSEYRNGTWINPVSISPRGKVAWSSQVAMDDNGNAVIVWQQYEDNGKEQIFKSEYRNGTWNTELLTNNIISPNGKTNDPHPQVAMDNNGNAVIVWHQCDDYNNSNCQIFKSEYRNGIWTNPASLTDNISSDGQNAYYYPQVAMDDNGNAVIVWNQYDGNGNHQIFKSEYRNGTWINPASLTDNISPEGQDAKSPQVAMDDNGNAVIVWSQYDGSNYQIFESEYRNGTWTNPTLTDSISPKGKNASKPQAAMDNNGNAVIVWHQYDGSNKRIFKSEYRNGTWINPTSLTNNISPEGQDAYRPQVAMDDNGNTVIVWDQYVDNGYRQIFMSEYR